MEFRLNDSVAKIEGTAVLRWNATGTVVAGLGSGGASGNPVLIPLGFTFDDANRLYIAEHWSERITRWIPGATNGTAIAGLANATITNTVQGFRNPADILLESNSGMYITNRWNHRLQCWPYGTSFRTTIAGTMACTLKDHPFSSMSFRSQLELEQ